MPIGYEDFNVQDATVRITNWRNLRRIDLALPLLTLVLVAIGWAMLYSASRNMEAEYLQRQIVAFGMGAVVAGFIIATDYRFVVALAPVLYVGMLGTLAAVILFGKHAMGAERWLAVGGITIQPSEFSKVVMIYFLTWYLTTVGERIKGLHWFVLTFVLTAIPTVLILKQPNLGTAATLFPLTFVMLYVAGCRLWHLGLVVLAALSLVPVVWLQIKDFDPAFRVVDADARGNVDGNVSYEEFGAFFGIPVVPEMVQEMLTEADTIDAPQKSKCKLLLMGYAEDGSRHIRGVPKTENDWLPTLEGMQAEGLNPAGIFFSPEFKGMSLVDADNNGLITEAEFKTLDKNNDGIISREDKGKFELYHHQKERIYTFLNPEHGISSSGWQTHQSKISVGSGGLTGKGYMQGTQTELKYLPEHHTDFIFSLLAEELGFVGVAGVIVLFVLFLLRGLGFAREAPELMGTLLATGVVTILGFHMFVNIAITIGILPVTGIPLPFLSYGRNFYLVTMACVGILLNVPMRRNIFVNQ